MSDQELKRRAEDVLLGRAEFAGDTADGSFCMRTYDGRLRMACAGRNFLRRRLGETSRMGAKVHRRKFSGNSGRR